METPPWKKKFQKLISLNLKSLSESGCTPHLVYSPNTIRKFDNLASINIPIQITYASNLCMHEKHGDDEYGIRINIPMQITNASKVCKYNTPRVDENKLRTCICKIDMEQTKFIKSFPHRHITRCHAFVMLWSYPSDYSFPALLLLNYIRLGFFNRIDNSKSHTANSIHFPTSYIGRVYTIFVLDTTIKLNIEGLNDIVNIYGKPHPLYHAPYRYFDQLFFLELSTQKLYGATARIFNGDKNFETSMISSNEFIKDNMDRYLVETLLQSDLYYKDDEMVDRTYFVSLDGKRMPKFPWLSSLMVSRLQNISLIERKKFTGFSLSTRGYVFVHFTTNLNRLTISAKNSFFRLKGHALFLHSFSFNFITCDGYESQITFTWTTNSFQLSVWISLVATFGIWVIFAHRYTKVTNTVFLTYAILLEQSFPLNASWMKSKFFIRSLVPIILGSIILTNCYKSLFVTDLTAPRPQKTIQSLEELSTLNYTIYSFIAKEWKRYYEYGRVNFFGNHYLPKRVGFVINAIAHTWHECQSNKRNSLPDHMFPFKYFTWINKFTRIGFCKQWVKTGLLLFRRITIPTGFPYVSIPEKIGECNKSAFIGDEHDLSRFYNPKLWRNTKPKANLYHGRVSKMTGVPARRTVEIHTGLYEVANFLKQELSSILQSGIYDKWIEYLSNPQKNVKFKHKLLQGMNKRLNFQDHNFITLFYIFGIACGISSFTLLIEVLNTFFKILVLRLKISYRKLQNYFYYVFWCPIL